jgi:hypothetical protein
MITINVKHKIEDCVYLITDREQKERIIIGYYVDSCTITYLLRCGTEESTHYDFELTENINILTKL